MLFNFLEKLSDTQLLEAGKSLQLGIQLVANVSRVNDALEAASRSLSTGEVKSLHELISIGGHVLVKAADGDVFMEAVDLAGLEPLSESLKTEIVRDEIDWEECKRLFGEVKDRVIPVLEEVEEEDQEEMEECALAESFGGIDQDTLAETGGEPLTMKVAIIRPGWGNERDNHYYSAEMLKANADKFVGAKMFETDHKDSETNNRTWVSTVTKHDGFAEDGSPVFEVLAHSPDFIARARNLKAAVDGEGKSLIEKLHCSIKASGLARPGKVGEREGNIVEEITSVKSVDWVSQAGAGGRALDIGESLEEGDPDPKPKVEFLGKARVEEILEAAKLPKVSQERLAESQYLDEEAVGQAVQSEREYLRKATGSGKPFGQGSTATPDTVAPNAEQLAEVELRKQRVAEKYSRLGRK